MEDLFLEGGGKNRLKNLPSAATKEGGTGGGLKHPCGVELGEKSYRGPRTTRGKETLAISGLLKKNENNTPKGLSRGGGRTSGKEQSTTISNSLSWFGVTIRNKTRSL